MVWKTTLATLAAAVALCAPAAAAFEPTAYATAKNGTFTVVSGVLVLPKATELNGVWLDDTLGCTEQRTLRVAVEVFYSSATGATKRKRLSRTGSVANCAEGGPNFGFLFRAQRYGFACANGAWKPGSYSLATTTTDLAGGLSASASLVWQKTGACP
jgi:hypothetical protein